MHFLADKTNAMRAEISNFAQSKKETRWGHFRYLVEGVVAAIPPYA
jgi:hypothetical protein